MLYAYQLKQQLQKRKEHKRSRVTSAVEWTLFGSICSFSLFLSVKTDWVVKEIAQQFEKYICLLAKTYIFVCCRVNMKLEPVVYLSIKLLEVTEIVQRVFLSGSNKLDTMCELVSL